jgi:ADP-heptose:LPS heptosyltransferase
MSDHPPRPRLLLFEQRLIGDAIMSLPFVRSAEAAFEVHVTCAAHSTDIFKMALPEERIIAWTPPWIVEGGGGAKWREAGFPGYLRRLRAVHADVAASVWADARVHILMALSGCKVRAAFPMTRNNFYASHLAWRRKQIRIGALLNVAGSLLTARPLLTTKVNRTDFYQHHVEDFRDLACALGIAWDETRPWLPPRPDASPLAAPHDGRPVWLVHPGARYPGRRWPLESFVRIIREVLVPAGVRVLFARAPELGDALPPLPAGVEVLEPVPLREFMGICATADVLLCNDTGVSHMGAALGKRVVSILSNAEPRWFAPRGSEQYVVARDVCAFRPCLNRCMMPSFICLEAVTYEMVRDMVLSVLAPQGVEFSPQA